MSRRPTGRRRKNREKESGTSSRIALKGHQRREGRQLTFGPGVPYIPPDEWRTYLQFSDPSTPLLGDTQDWDDLQRSQSIIVGSRDTVYRRFLSIIERAPVGHLLNEFHLGNLADGLARRSMELFSPEVAPRLREDSAKLFGRSFPQNVEIAE